MPFSETFAYPDEELKAGDFVLVWGLDASDKIELWCGRLLNRDDDRWEIVWVMGKCATDWSQTSGDYGTDWIYTSQVFIVVKAMDFISGHKTQRLGVYSGLFDHLLQRTGQCNFHEIDFSREQWATFTVRVMAWRCALLGQLVQISSQNALEWTRMATTGLVDQA